MAGRSPGLSGPREVGDWRAPPTQSIQQLGYYQGNRDDHHHGDDQGHAPLEELVFNLREEFFHLPILP